METNEPTVKGAAEAAAGFIATGTVDDKGKLLSLKLIHDPDNKSIETSNKPINAVFGAATQAKTGKEKISKKTIFIADTNPEAAAAAAAAGKIPEINDDPSNSGNTSNILFKGGSRAHGGSRSKRTQKRRQRKQRQNGKSRRV